MSKWGKIALLSWKEIPMVHPYINYAANLKGIKTNSWSLICRHKLHKMILLREVHIVANVTHDILSFDQRY